MLHTVGGCLLAELELADHTLNAENHEFLVYSVLKWLLNFCQEIFVEFRTRTLTNTDVSVPYQ